MLTTNAPSGPGFWQPFACSDHLVMTHVGDEATQAIHHLSSTSHAVWAACDGTRTPGIIARELSAEVSDEVVRLALSQLAAAARAEAR